ncbi:MAG: FAD-binding oxidoreductase [Pseudopedobacter saltans]|uniref:FAD-binding oxidoreductase n=1 Tax=Pseudopedobacter saltans TaxID=151895 RepID=A0A2W5HBZ7_9SPHI|nr:MAG: FAD-binding oxidoreductase [Pseudopedobacter saltans]
MGVIITSEILNQLTQIVGDKNILTDSDSLNKYGRDETEKLLFLPQVVLRPGSADEISQIMRICNENQIPVTPRAGGTGLSGGAIPTHGGVLLSIDRLNKILDIDEQNLQVTTETGVITEVLQDAVKEKGLFYPPDPSSKGSCFIGGNIAENSGGPKAVKYGKVKDYVLNLEVVLPNGDIIWTGANVLKNSTGYNLTQLMVGSEGTLGIVTKAVFKLIPYPKHDMLMLVPFHSLEGASAAVSAIFRAGFTPSCLELTEIDALKITSQFVDNNAVPVDDSIAAHLIVEVDGNDRDVLMKDMEGIAMALEPFDIGEIFFAEDTTQKEELWKLRRRAAEAVKSVGYTVEEDTVVPRAELPKLIHGVKELGIKYDFKVVCYGHAGDGNIHVRINKEGFPNSYGHPEMEEILTELFKLVVSLGGTISGEHGIGLTQKEYLLLKLNPIQLELMRGIKKVFDPNNILNPGKIFD